MGKYKYIFYEGDNKVYEVVEESVLKIKEDRKIKLANEIYDVLSIEDCLDIETKDMYIMVRISKTGGK